MGQRIKWVIEVSVDKSWVADGFDFTKQRARDMVGHALPMANGNEYDARILAKPDPLTVRRIQGYKK